MISKRVLFVAAMVVTAVSFFTLGVIQAHRADDRVSYDTRLDALHEEIQRALLREPAAGVVVPVGTAGKTDEDEAVAAGKRARLVADIKEELRSEMGLLPVRLIRERQSSFAELYTYDNHGQRSYGTAGYLGHGYFITVKHAVVPLAPEGRQGDRPSDRTITAVKVVYKGKEIPARIVDTGKAQMEVDRGDWAIVKTRDLDLPALRVDTSFAYEFADPIFRLGNDYSKGVVVSTGYVGQRTETGLVTSLTDGHPGVSGGGVLDQRGALVGIPIGRMQGDYRFSFILPIRAEMLRKVPDFLVAEPARPVAAE
jgi:Trypsin-like peptidase domain